MTDKMKIPETVGDFANISRGGQGKDPNLGISLQVARYGKYSERSKTKEFE